MGGGVCGGVGSGVWGGGVCKDVYVWGVGVGVCGRVVCMVCVVWGWGVVCVWGGGG